MKLSIPKLPKLSATRITLGIFTWSQVFLPLIALFASLASAVRTFQTTTEIYLASGTGSTVVTIVAIAFTLAVEGAIFFLALAQEKQHIQWRQAKKRRHVTTIKTIYRAIKVRIGLEEPLTYDQMPESDTSVSLVIWIAFGYALVSNFYMGMRPLIEQQKSTTVQAFITGLGNASAKTQTDFIVDAASVIFPPFMALIAGKLTSRFASKIAGGSNRGNSVQPAVSKTGGERAKTVQDKPQQKGATERLIEHLNDHPEDARLSQRKLAQNAKVSVGTVNAFRTRSGEQPTEPIISVNGHRKE